MQLLVDDTPDKVIECILNKVDGPQVYFILVRNIWPEAPVKVINVKYPQYIDESGHTSMGNWEERVTSVK